MLLSKQNMWKVTAVHEYRHSVYKSKQVHATTMPGKQSQPSGISMISM